MWGGVDTDIAFVWNGKEFIRIDVEVAFGNTNRYLYTGPAVLWGRIEHHFILI